MGGYFGVASKDDCVSDLFYGTDYHSHLGNFLSMGFCWPLSFKPHCLVENGIDHGVHDWQVVILHRLGQ